MPNLLHYDRPFVNRSSETIPPYAVVQIAPSSGSDAWVPNQAARDYFSVIKPNDQGKLYLLNGPSHIPVNKPGRGVRAHGHHALVDPSIPLPIVAGTTLGPMAGQWHLGAEGTGFVVVGDLQGSGASSPGVFPPVAATRRIRVTATTAATPAAAASDVYALTKPLEAGRWAWENGNVHVYPGALVRDCVQPMIVDPDQDDTIRDSGKPWLIGQLDEDQQPIFYDAAIYFHSDDIEAGKGEALRDSGGVLTGKNAPPVRFVRGTLHAYQVLNDQDQMEDRKCLRVEQLLNPLQLFQVSAPSVIAGINFTAPQPLKIIGQQPIGSVDIDNSMFTFNVNANGKLLVVRGRRPDSSANNVPQVNLPIQAECPAEEPGGGGGF